MGPRRNGRGDVAEGGILADGAMLQWGHAEMGVETYRQTLCDSSCLYASMGPRRNGRGDCSPSGQSSGRWLLLQWGHAEMGVETWCRFAGSRFKRRFNGATPKWAWRQKAINEMLSLWEASMGPRRNGRGDLLGLRGR